MGPKVISLSDENLFQYVKDCLESYGLIIYPTDSIYGLGADARKDHSVLRVFEAKRRPPQKPLSVVVSRDTLPLFAKLDKQAIKFIDKFLPGPLTVLLNQKGKLSSQLNLNEPDRIGFRILPPKFRISEFVDIYRIPLTATSANISGSQDNTLRVIVRDLNLKNGDLVIRTEFQMSFIPSTIVDLTSIPPKILREGVLSRKLREWGCV
ncbi:MAG: L-threonylcarbamoyladenylate synthase [Candidatus Hodarchaeota archaeon]